MGIMRFLLPLLLVLSVAVCTELPPPIEHFPDDGEEEKGRTIDVPERVNRA